MKMNCLVCVRIHNCNSSSFPPINSLLSFLHACQDYTENALVCLGAKSLKELTEQLSIYEEAVATSDVRIKVTIQPVFPWGHFTSSLNFAVLFAQDNSFPHILYQSLEYRTSRDIVTSLFDILVKDDKAFVCGVEMNGHEFKNGWNELRGRTCPWNTCALWKVDRLGLVGFPLIGDGVASDRSIGGVEEVTAIAMLQQLRIDEYGILVRFGDDESTWSTAFEDPQRAQYHEKKMISKDIRPQAQLKVLNTSPTQVWHMVYQGR